MTHQAFFQKIYNYLTFKGNVNRTNFLFLLLFAELVHHVVFRLVYQLDHILPAPNIIISLCEISKGILLCYLFGIAIAARLRNLTLNHSLAYFYVVFLWFVRYHMMHAFKIPFYIRFEFYGMVIFLALIPLFVNDKRVLQFWK